MTRSAAPISGRLSGGLYPADKRILVSGFLLSGGRRRGSQCNGSWCISYTAHPGTSGCEGQGNHRKAWKHGAGVWHIMEYGSCLLDLTADDRMCAGTPGRRKTSLCPSVSVIMGNGHDCNTGSNRVPVCLFPDAVYAVLPVHDGVGGTRSKLCRRSPGNMI